MLEITIVIISFIIGVGFGIWCYKIGRKHGIIIGHAQLAKEILDSEFFMACKTEFEGKLK